MHTLLEGVVQYEVRLVLLHCINSNLASPSQINGAIVSHEYGYSEISDKPVPLKDAVFNGDERYKLKHIHIKNYKCRQNIPNDMTFIQN